MSVYFSRNGKTLHQGHVLDCLAELPAESVQCVVTSPPYFGLRAYGTQPQIWGGDKDCPHNESEPAAVRPLTGGTGAASAKQVTNAGSQYWNQLPGDSKGSSGTPTDKNGRGEGYARGEPRGWLCSACGAWKGELGSEPTPDLFVAHLVEVFAAVRRVLRRDGCLIVNLSDSYAGSGKGPTGASSKLNGGRGVEPNEKVVQRTAELRQGFVNRITQPPGVRPKSRLAVPERFVLAMLQDGWIYRDDRAWCKAAPMPESVRDRCTQAWEHVYMFTREGAYFWDQAAVLEAASYGEGPRTSVNGMGNGELGNSVRFGGGANGRNPRNYVVLGPDPFPGAHFAVWPRAIPEFWIRAATSERGACARCGAPWRRSRQEAALVLDGKVVKPAVRESGTWQPSCRCGPDAGTRSCVVLDPFAGSGTTLLVAHLLGREAWGVELNPDYCRIAERRLAADVLPLETA